MIYDVKQLKITKDGDTYNIDIAEESPVMTGATSSTAGASGLVPAPAAGDQDKVLTGAGTWGNAPYPPNMTGATSSAAGAAGLVPAPAAGDNGKFLKGDGSWDDVPDPQVMTGATSSTAGTSGLVPAPAAGDVMKVLTGSGSWQPAPGARIIQIETTVTNTSGAYTNTILDDRVSDDMKAISLEIANPYAFNDKITVTCNTGSLTFSCDDVTGTSAVKINVIKASSNTLVVTSEEFDILDAGKVDKQQNVSDAGKVLGIGNDGVVTPVVPAAEVNDMTGATSSTAGAHGLAPAPSAGDQNKFLRGDGSWQNVPNPQTMTGATASTAGTGGLVPAPAAGDQDMYLKGDGTWDSPANGTLRVVPFSIGVASWTLSGGVYSYTYPTAYVTASSVEFIEYDASYRAAVRGDMSAVKATGGGGVIFTTDILPVATLTGEIRVFDSDDGKVAIVTQMTALPTIREVPFTLAVADWSLNADDIYEAVFATAYVTQTSHDFVEFDESIENATDGIRVVKATTGMKFLSRRIPAGSISGTITPLDNADGKIAVALQDTVMPIANGGTGANTLAGAKENLGITALYNKLWVEDHQVATNSEPTATAIDLSQYATEYKYITILAGWAENYNNAIMFPLSISMLSVKIPTNNIDTATQYLTFSITDYTLKVWGSTGDGRLNYGVLLTN